MREPGVGLQHRALGGDHGEIEDGQSLVAAVEPEHLADHAEFEGMHTIEENNRHVCQHGISVAVIRWSMTVLPLLSVAGNGDSGDMDIFLTVLALIALFVLLGLPSLIWHLKDRAVDRQLRRAEHPDPPEGSRPAADDLPRPAVGPSPRARAPRMPRRPRTTAGQAH